jgi:Undecaprenyl-phosphate galactose phosphotransferase WbaP
MANGIDRVAYAPDGVANLGGYSAESPLAAGALLRPEVKVAYSWSTMKRVTDLLGALVLLICFSPLFLIVSLCIARSGGEVFFGHRRVGRNGKPFYCYKFRTMIPNAEAVLKELLASDPSLREEWAQGEKLKNDPRVTKIGQFLRRTSLDELPQLYNVLRGEMSLVGPRPVTQPEMQRYGRAAKWYLAVRPGLTGLWQVSGRNDISYRRRVALDTYYVKAQSLPLDIQILFATIRVVIRGTGTY